MTMWTSAEAINAEIEYRRERVIWLANRTRTGRTRRTRRKEQQTVATNRRQAEGVEHATAERAEHQEHGAKLPAQRTSGSSSATNQPV